MLSPFLSRDGDAHRELVAHARRIAAALGPGAGRIVLSCRQAGAFVPGLLGGWLAGATIDLLPNVQAATLDRVDADTEVRAVLHDDASRQARSDKAIYVPGVTSGAEAAAASTLPEIAVRMTTSGTTERPRYIAKTMAQLVAELDVLATAVPVARCVLATVPLSHFYGLLFGALLPLRFGARIVSHEALLPADVAAVIEREGVDLVISTPAHLRAMAAARMPRGLRVISSGARLPFELHEQLIATHGWHVTDVLGSTETGGIATREHAASAWQPLPSVQVSGPDNRLVVESPWSDGRVELADRIDKRADGTFEHLGRSSELIKIAGKRAHARAIEETVLALPGVTDVALLVHGAGGNEPRVALAVSVAPDGPPVTRQAIIAAIRAQFDDVFAPRLVKIVPRIPRTERGKIAAEELRALFGFDEIATTDRIPARKVAPGQYAVEIPRDLVFFRGHFDAYAILPGAVIVERLVWPIVTAELPDVKRLRAIRRLRFRRPVLPEQRLSVTVKREPRSVTFEVSSETEVVASGHLVVD